MATIQTTRALGAAIRAARRDQQLTQGELARRAGVGRPWLSELETGKRTVEVGRVLNVIGALGLALELVHAPEPGADHIDLAEILGEHHDAR